MTDPPYPMIRRPYGIWTEAEWWSLIVEGVIPQVRRILKPTGSAVFILQPNSRKVGSMRGWLWEFMAWACREWNMVQDVWWWNMVQDVWWWNTAALPLTKNDPNHLRSSLKACVWLGPADCFREASGVLLDESSENKYRRERGERQVYRNKATRANVVKQRITASSVERGGVTPFNLLPFGTDTTSSGGHGARTPLALCRWWTKYICTPSGTVLDPFLGSGTTAIAAMREGRSCIGVERVPEYVTIANKRIAEEEAKTPLFSGGAEGV